MESFSSTQLYTTPDTTPQSCSASCEAASRCNTTPDTASRCNTHKFPTHPIQQFLQDKLSDEPSWYIPKDKVVEIPRVGLTPYPFYFQSDPLESVPTIYSNQAGWSSRILLPPKVLARPYYPINKFQSACNTVYTENENGRKTCITLYR